MEVLPTNPDSNLTTTLMTEQIDMAVADLELHHQMHIIGTCAS